MPLEECLTYTVNQKRHSLYFGHDILSNVASIITKNLKPSHIFIICDDAVTPLYGIKVAHSLHKADLPYTILSIVSGESAKTFERATFLCDQLLKENLDRQTLLIAIGGGSIGDLVGFTASILLRGLDWVYVPTTMLAQADSSIGGKTGVNTPYGKNLIGSFHFPKIVINDAHTLQSLPLSQIWSGYVEVFKHALLMKNVENLDTLLKLTKSSLQDPETLWKHIQVSARQKIDLIQDDWFEEKFNGRARLNFGHTFGHGYETLSHYSISHGQAVAMGMCTAIDFAVWTGLCNSAYGEMVKKHFDTLGIHWRYDTFFKTEGHIEEFINILKKDKKQANGQINFILPTHDNEIKITSGFTSEQIFAFINQTCLKSAVS